MALIKGVYDLKAFQEGYSLLLDVRPFANKMPQHEQYNGAADQIRRASTSVCANLAEGFGKNKSKAELRRFVRIALGSAEEMDFWLKLSIDLGYITPEKGQEYRERYNLVCRLLNGFDQSLSTNIKN